MTKTKERKEGERMTERKRTWYAKYIGYCFTETCYPWFKDGIAKMHAFADVHFCIAMDEPTANNMANTMMIFGILCK